MSARHNSGMIVPDALKAARKAAGMTQQQLADALKVEQPTINRWENGKRSPEPSQVASLAAALQVDPSALYDREALSRLGLAPQDTEPALSAEVANIWDYMNFDQRRQLARIARALLDEAG